MLFRALNADIFTLFAGGNRRLYEAVLLDVYDEFFRAEMLFPAQGEVVSAIYSSLARNAQHWRDDEAEVLLDTLSVRGSRRLRRRRSETADAEVSGEAMARARHIYNRLLQTGWLDENRYGLKVTVDMPAGALRLAEFLWSLTQGISEQVGGLVVQVKNALDAARINARDSALGVNKAAKDAAAFGRYLRSVLSALRDVDRQVMGSQSVEERLKYYFHDFVEQVLLRDYADISTTSHPYRFRHHIFETIQAIEDSAMDMDSLAEAYFEARLGQDIRDASAVVQDDLLTIRTVFDRIEDAFRRIQQHRGRLETRLRNTVRYAGRQTGGFLQRSERVVILLDRLLQTSVAIEATGPMEAQREFLSPFLLARPRSTRPAVVSGVLDLQILTPLQMYRRDLQRSYLDRLNVRPAQVQRFLERRVLPLTSQAASDLHIGDLDDFLAFEALRVAVAGADGGQSAKQLLTALSQDFEFEAREGDLVDNDWIACRGFIVRRKTDAITLERSHAD